MKIPPDPNQGPNEGRGICTLETSASEVSPLIRALAIIAVPLLLFAADARAELSQDAVFRSIEDNVSDSGDSRVLILVLCVMAALILLLALFGRRSQRRAVPKALNNQAKLLREVLKGLPLRSSELKQLKLLCAAARTADGEPLESALTLLLCPSVLARSLEGGAPPRANRKIVVQLWRKLQPRATATAAVERSAPRSQPTS